MSIYYEHLSDIFNIIKSTKDREKAAKNVSKLIGKEVSWEAVSAGYRRCRNEYGEDIPPIEELLGSETLEYVPKTAIDGFEIKLPKLKKGPDVLPTIVEIGWVPRKVAIIPDIHFPIHDPWAIDCVVSFLRDYKPNYIVLLGDLLDCLCLSRHDNSHSAEKMMDIKYQLNTEIEASAPFVKELLKITECISLIEGNHELRREQILNKNPGLRGIEALEPKKFFQIPDPIKWIGNKQRLKIGNAYFEHGDQVVNSRGSKHIADSMAQRRPWCNTYTGHFHTIDRKNKVAYWPDGSHELFVTATIGHLSMVKEHQHYAKLPSWSHGLGLLEFWEDGDNPQHSFDQIIFTNYTFSRNGKIYSGKKTQ